MLGFGLFSVVDHFPKELTRTTAEFYGELLEQVEAAETLGFRSFWVADHQFHEYGGIPRPPVWMAAAAARTRRIRLGAGVVVLPFDNPLRTAEDYAMVDVLSGGRLDLGTGSGYLKHEYAGFNLDPEEWGDPSGRPVLLARATSRPSSTSYPRRLVTPVSGSRRSRASTSANRRALASPVATSASRSFRTAACSGRKAFAVVE